MANTKVRMTVEFEIEEKVLKEYGVSGQTVFDSLIFGKNEDCDGFYITTNIPDFRPEDISFLKYGRLVSAEQICLPGHSFENLQDKLTEMFRSEIELSGVSRYGMTEAEVKAMLLDQDALATLIGLARSQIFLEDAKDKDAVARVMQNDFQSKLDDFRFLHSVSAVRAGENVFKTVLFEDLRPGDRIFSSRFELHTVKEGYFRDNGLAHVRGHIPVEDGDPVALYEISDELDGSYLINGFAASYDAKKTRQTGSVPAVVMTHSGYIHMPESAKFKNYNFSSFCVNEKAYLIRSDALLAHRLAPGDVADLLKRSSALEDRLSSARSRTQQNNSTIKGHKSTKSR